jgi:peroxidase
MRAQLRPTCPHSSSSLGCSCAGRYRGIIDLWVGCLAEDHVNGGLVGETMFAIFKDQFERTRDGDRFWYESYPDPTTLALVQQQTVGAMIKRNTTIGSEMQDEVFHVPTQ